MGAKQLQKPDLQCQAPYNKINYTIAVDIACTRDRAPKGSGPRIQKKPLAPLSAAEVASEAENQRHQTLTKP